MRLPHFLLPKAIKYDTFSMADNTLTIHQANVTSAPGRLQDAEFVRSYYWFEQEYSFSDMASTYL